jgi:hypothetical protein
VPRDQRGYAFATEEAEAAFLAEVDQRSAQPSGAARARWNQGHALVNRTLRSIAEDLIRSTVRRTPVGEGYFDDLVSEYAGWMPPTTRRLLAERLGESTDIRRAIGAGDNTWARAALGPLAVEVANELETRRWAPPERENPTALAAQIPR